MARNSNNSTMTIKPCRTRYTINHFKAHPNQVVWYRTEKVWIPGLVTNVDRFHIEVNLPGNKLQPLSLTSNEPGILELELWDDNRDKRITILKTGVSSKDIEIRNKCCMSMTFIRTYIIPVGSGNDLKLQRQSSLAIGLSVNIASNHSLRNIVKTSVPMEARSSIIRNPSPPVNQIDNSGYELSKPRLKRSLQWNGPEPSYDISKPKHRFIGLENGIARPKTTSRPKPRVLPSTTIESDLSHDKECDPAYDVSRPVLKRIVKGKVDCHSNKSGSLKPSITPNKLPRQMSTGIETVQYLGPLVCNEDGNGSNSSPHTRIVYSSDEDQYGHAEQVERSHADHVPIGQEVLVRRTSRDSSNSLDEDSDTRKKRVDIYAPARILAHTSIPNHFRVRFYDGTERECVSRNSILVLGDHAFGSVVVERIPDPPKVCLSNYQNPILEMRLRLVVPLLDEIVCGTRICARAQQYRSHSTKRRMDLNVNCGGDPYSPNEMAFIRQCLQVRYLRAGSLLPPLGFLSTDLPVVDQQFLDLVLIPECVVRLLILTHLLDHSSDDIDFNNSATAPIPQWRWKVMSEYTLYSSQYNDPTTSMQNISETNMRLNYLMSMEDESIYLQMAEQLLRDSHWVFGLLELQRVY